MERLFLISVHNPENTDEQFGATTATGKDSICVTKATIRLLREIESKEREEAKYKGLTEEEIT